MQYHLNSNITKKALATLFPSPQKKNFFKFGLLKKNTAESERTLEFIVRKHYNTKTTKATLFSYSVFGH
jgi:hypothetical protein